MKQLAILCSLIITLSSLQAVAEELPAEAQKMLDDLGAPAVQQNKNGKTLRCRYGGHKKVSVSPLADATLFSGDYFNCRDAGYTRDGYFEVIVRDWNIVGQSSKRSINGELQDAVRTNEVKKVRALIAKGADVNYSENISQNGTGNIEGWTPLMSAALNGDYEIAKMLLKAGAWVNYMNSRAFGALWLAASSGSVETVKLLVNNRAYINNSNDEETTPLMIAAMNGHSQVVKYLINAKASLNHIHKDGDSALMFALANKHNETAQLLIDAGADISIRNRFGATALLIAIAENNEDMVRELISHKADLTVRTNGGKSAMDIATAKGNGNIIRMLMPASAANPSGGKQ